MQKEELLKFVPISSQYFVPFDSDAKSYIRTERKMPGFADVTIVLNLIQNPNLVVNSSSIEWNSEQIESSQIPKASRFSNSTFHNKFKSLDY